MVKRVASALLWLFAVAWAFNFISAFTGLSPLIGGLVALGTALFVGIDPLHAVWMTPSAPITARDVALAVAPSRVPSQV